MKNYLKFSTIIFFFFILIASCEESEEIPKTGEPFARGTGIQFYYSNDQGEDLLDLRDNTILPVAFQDTFQLPEPPTDEDTIRYYYDGGKIIYDTEINRYFWNTFIYGRSGYVEHQFYVRLSENDIDTIDVEFSFTTDNVIGSDIYAYIDKLFYNGTLIRHEIQGENSGSEYTPEKIFIQKDNGKTIITFDN